MRKFYFTFGHGHYDRNHPSLAGYYTVIEAESEDEAREKLWAVRQNKWAMCYASAEKAGVGKWNLRLIPFGELTDQPGGTR